MEASKAVKQIKNTDVSFRHSVLPPSQNQPDLLSRLGGHWGAVDVDDNSRHDSGLFYHLGTAQHTGVSSFL